MSISPVVPRSRGEARGDLLARVFAATVTLVLEKGVRKLRTADIAAAAGTTESTLFRHFTKLEEVLERTYDNCWLSINQHLAHANFDNPRPADPTQQLLADMASLWEMGRSEPDRSAATLAFLFLRRRGEVFSTPGGHSEEQQRFERRIAQLCEQVAEANGLRAPGDRGVSILLTQLLMNYAATVWLTWFCMPSTEPGQPGSIGAAAEDEAQLGVLVLLDRFERAHRPSGSDAPKADSRGD